jgi:hypothetical protein
MAISSFGSTPGNDVTFTTGLPPTAVTLNPTNRTATSAQLNGTVNPNGSSTNYYFEYGTTSSYGLRTSILNAGSGTSAINVIVSLSGLTTYTEYHYRLVATNAYGTAMGGDATFILTSAEGELNGLPEVFSLSQNYPNPFNPTTKIQYQLPKVSSISLKVLNTLGEVVATLVEGSKGPGSYVVEWAPQLPSGIYFYRLQAGEFVETKKMILLR